MAGDVSIRGGMVDSLVNSGILIGKTRKEVLGLWGKYDYGRTNLERHWAYAVYSGNQFYIFAGELNQLTVDFRSSSYNFDSDSNEVGPNPNRVYDVYVSD